MLGSATQWSKKRTEQTEVDGTILIKLLGWLKWPWRKREDHRDIGDSPLCSISPYNCTPVWATERVSVSKKKNNNKKMNISKMIVVNPWRSNFFSPWSTKTFYVVTSYYAYKLKQGPTKSLPSLITIYTDVFYSLPCLVTFLKCFWTLLNWFPGLCDL